MNTQIKLGIGGGLLVVALVLLAVYCWPTSTAGKNLPVEITCLSCGQTEHTTWDDVIKRGDHQRGEIDGWFLPCKSCGKRAYAHNAGDPVPENVKTLAKTPEDPPK